MIGSEQADRNPGTIEVLYVHHSGIFGGASRSLLELVSAFPPGSVRARLVVPRGRVAEMFREAGVEVLETRGIAQFDCTRYGHYRGVRWLILLRELAYLPATLAALRTAKRRWPNVSIVHINDATLVPCIVWAGRILRCPTVVHVRALLAGSSTPRRTRWLAGLLKRSASAVIAIDETVRATLPDQVSTHVVHNGFAPGLGPRVSAPQVLAELSPTSLKIAMVGSLSAMKGCYEFVQAARVLAAKGLDIDFILVGEDVRRLSGLRGVLLRALGFARPVRAELEKIVASSGLQSRVHFIGFTTEIKAIYDAIDVVCFPSLLDAPGRPVFEAAFSHVPSIVAVNDPRPDTLVDGETCLCIPARNAHALADAIERLYHDRDSVERMGERAFELATRNFDIRKNATQLLAIYRQVLGSKASRNAACAS